jgi:hypothetical protein
VHQAQQLHDTHFIFNSMQPGHDYVGDAGGTAAMVGHGRGGHLGCGEWLGQCLKHWPLVETAAKKQIAKMLRGKGKRATLPTLVQESPTYAPLDATSTSPELLTQCTRGLRSLRQHSTVPDLAQPFIV